MMEMKPAKLQVAAVVLIILLVFSTPFCLAGDKIRVLIIGAMINLQLTNRFFDLEPGVVYMTVPARDPGGFFLSEADLVKMIRLYFPRSYEELRTYDLIMLTSPDFFLITPKQDKWMYDSIREGAGGYNDGSVFSIVSGVAEAWSISLTQQSFPNDAPAVTARRAGESPKNVASVDINDEAKYRILSDFIPFGVEDIPGGGRLVLHREGSEVLAWQVGNFGPIKVDFMAAWEYENGRTITNGGWYGNGFWAYPTDPQKNQYSPDMLMNMVFWLTNRNLIEDIVVFHRIKGIFAEYTSRMGVLVSLMDFIDKFGANTQKIQDEIFALEDIYDMAVDHYLGQEFIEAEKDILDSLERFSQAEEVARREKNAALLWVYTIEWLVTVSTFFIAGFVLWSLMVRRRLYRDVSVTKLRGLEKGS